jgi:hypothetical protein
MGDSAALGRRQMQDDLLTLYAPLDIPPIREVPFNDFDILLHGGQKRPIGCLAHGDGDDRTHIDQHFYDMTADKSRPPGYQDPFGPVKVFHQRIEHSAVSRFQWQRTPILGRRHISGPLS